MSRLSALIVWPVLDDVMCQVVTLTSAAPAPGAECVTAGWGTHTTSGLFMTNILQRLSATIVDKEECNTVSIQHHIYLAQAQGQDKVTLHIGRDTFFIAQS